MLPIRWILPVGSLFLVIAVLALAFIAPDGSGSQMPKAAPVRSTFIELGERPEWRQFIIFSAIQRRADELHRLRELPDTPARTDDAPIATEIAGLAVHGSDPEDNDETGVNAQTPAATVPPDTGEALPIPVAPSEKNTPAIRTPQQVKSHNQKRVKVAQHVRRRVRAPASGQLFPFGAETGQRPAVNTNNYFENQAWRAPKPNAAAY